MQFEQKSKIIIKNDEKEKPEQDYNQEYKTRGVGCILLSAIYKGI